MRKKFVVACTILLILPLLVIFVIDSRRASEAKQIEFEWDRLNIAKVTDFGATSTLEILPLVNWHSARDDLRTEPGVAYLIRTDDQTILFDLGFNRFQESPSPLEYNMLQLDVDKKEIDTIFISHPHRDHVGGVEWAKKMTFGFGLEQPSLDEVTVYAPVPMTYPNISVQTVNRPRALSTGVASTGPIARRLFVGRIDEQALVINLKGRGLVVIVGCGHQTVPKLLERVQAAFDEPLYAIVGDLHYPVPRGRLFIAGVDAQRRLASGEGIFAPIEQATINRDVDLLSRGLGFLALGGHDTNDIVLDNFAELMGDGFVRVEVGRPILFGNEGVH